MAGKYQKKTVDTLTHEEASRKNIPTAEYQSVMGDEDKSPVQVAYARRNRDLDPQLVWRGKDKQDLSDLVVNAPPLYIQEKVHPKALIDDLQRNSRKRQHTDGQITPDLFDDFNGLPKDADRTEFYQYDANWQNRMILGDSLQVMASLTEREGLRGQVQCIYLDPPYGIKFNSNFQWSTTDQNVKDDKFEKMTREPEQVKAFRDTWKDGIHSYLTYLRDRLILARDLLANSGSIFVQIGDENVHRVRSILDEVFGEDNFIQSIIIKKKSSALQTEPVNDYVLWACKDKSALKVRPLKQEKNPFSETSRFNKIELPNLSRFSLKEATEEQIKEKNNKLLNDDYPMVSQDYQESRSGAFILNGEQKFPGKNRHWTLDPQKGMRRLARANRLRPTKNTVRGVVYFGDYGQEPINNIWEFHGERNPVFVVQTNKGIIQRCLLLTTDPGDLILDPTCGSGTSATVAEQWGRRWITIDTSRVALALARARIMGSCYPYYLLADSPEGQKKEAQITRTTPSQSPTGGNIRHGFVYHRVPHVTLKSIANNSEIDTIWSDFQKTMDPLHHQLNESLGTQWEEWEIPRETKEHWPDEAKSAHSQWWEQRINRQREIDASIDAKADSEFLYDRPYVDNNTIRVSGPFTVESISPHRVLGVDENDELIDEAKEDHARYGSHDSFAHIVLENLKTAGVQQAHKEDSIHFTFVTPWPGEMICAEGQYIEGEDEDHNGNEKRAAIMIGPEFGTVSRPDLVQAAREAGDAGFDVLIACAFNYEAHATEFEKLGRIPVLKARMNAELHMADDLKNTGKGNLFVIFGEPDIEVSETNEGQIQVKVNGVDVFHPNSGEVRSDGPEGIACWFIDTDYNQESFFVRHAYFLGASDPYKSLKNTLKAEINEEAWETLYSDTSRPFEKPRSGRIAVKVINHLGDEVMKVFRV